jgi:hypothetical protein
LSRLTVFSSHARTTGGSGQQGQQWQDGENKMYKFYWSNLQKSQTATSCSSGQSANQQPEPEQVPILLNYFFLKTDVAAKIS